MKKSVLDLVISRMQSEFWKAQNLLVLGPRDGSYWRNAAIYVRSFEWIDYFLATLPPNELLLIFPSQTQRLKNKSKGDPDRFRQLIAAEIEKRVAPHTRRGKRIEEAVGGLACLYFNMHVLEPIKQNPRARYFMLSGMQAASHHIAAAELFLRRSRSPQGFDLLRTQPNGSDIMVSGTYDDILRWLSTKEIVWTEDDM